MEIFVKKPSPIHGLGIFTTRDLPMGMVLFKVLNNECSQVTPLGAYVNHQRYPNTTLHKMEDGWYLVSIMPILAGDELVANYHASPDCIEKPDPSW